MLIRLPALLTLLSVLLPGGCAVVKDGGISPELVRTFAAPQDLIARDFVSAIRQIESLPPAETTVDMQLAYRGDDFTMVMFDALSQAGYGVRWIDNEDSPSLFRYRLIAQDAAAAARRDTYELALGQIEMRRDYVTDGVRIRPVTPLLVRGTDARGISLNDSHFNTENAGINPKAHAVQTPSTRSIPQDASPLDPIVGSAGSVRPVSFPLVSLPSAKNVFELGSSNFADTIAARALVAEHILVFANDSMRLGDSNKKRVDQMVLRFNPQTDVFSVIGCSMGVTDVPGGNAALALGRAGRVVEALRHAGVDDRHILDEGCWSGDGALQNLPRRGVVLTLNRQE
ncbi:MAG: hypothetical protein AB8B64_02810 [Granulosicoccus sp.]